jgi:hypothetical protein
MRYSELNIISQQDALCFSGGQCPACEGKQCADLEQAVTCPSYTWDFGVWQKTVTCIQVNYVDYCKTVIMPGATCVLNSQNQEIICDCSDIRPAEDIKEPKCN